MVLVKDVIIWIGRFVMLFLIFVNLFFILVIILFFIYV